MIQVQDNDAERRSAKNATFLVDLEDYISEVVTSNHGMKEQEMLKVINENFHRSIQANIDYHSELAHAYHNDDSALENYHNLMARSYRTVLPAK